MKDRTVRMRNIATTLLLILALAPATAQSSTIPPAIVAGTLYEGTLSGRTEHSARIPEAGTWGIFLGAQEAMELTVTLPGGRVERHEYDQINGSFLFFEVTRPGEASFEFALDDSAGYAIDPFYAFVFNKAVDLAIDESGSFDLFPAPIADDPDELLRVGLFRVQPGFDALLTVRVIGERYDVNLLGGGPEAAGTRYDAYGDNPDEQDAIMQMPVLAGEDSGFIVIREPGGGGAFEAPVQLALNSEELIVQEPRELFFADFAVDRIEAGSGFYEGRKSRPFYYEGTAGESIAIVLESVEFDTYLIVRTPDGELITDDDGAYETNSLLVLDFRESGRYEIFASSFSGSSVGEFSVQVTTPDAAEEYIAENSDFGFGDFGPPERFSPDFSADEDRIAGITTLVPGAGSSGSLTEESSVYSGALVEIFELELRRATDLAISLFSDEFDTYLTVDPPAGFEITDDDGGEGRNSLLRIPGAEPGIYRIYAGSFGGSSIGSFRLEVSEYVAGPAAESVSGTRMNPGRSYTGRITSESPTYESRLVEVYEIRVAPRAFFTIDVSSDDFDTYLFVVDPDGSVTTDDDGGEFTNSRISVEARDGGVYRVYASSFGGASEGSFEIEYEEE